MVPFPGYSRTLEHRCLRQNYPAQVRLKRDHTHGIDRAHTSVMQSPLLTQARLDRARHERDSCCVVDLWESQEFVS